ncbi:hypothetical protein V6Z05_18100 [Leptospira venezuelensis]|uniref:hypothetical protein n=1 Tax=Leptospira venezuelensis TaxID=1958811 RepID=UPI000A36FF52|nr:hypothetical protein [Leptospira venezuelensis]
MFSKKRIEQLKEVLRGIGTANMKKKRRRKEYIEKLRNREITTKRYAEEVPIIVRKLSDKRFVKEAIECHRLNYGEFALQNALEDTRETVEIFRTFALHKLCELHEDYNEMRMVKLKDKEFKTLLDRTTYELVQVYPWLSEFELESLGL